MIRQLRYSEKTDHSLDLAIFLNGLPLFTAELKNPLNGQDVTDAITQYRSDRDPREPLFALGRCVAHFAVDPFLVYMTTQLKADKTVFLPFNIGNGEGKNKGAGNPPPKLGGGFSTSYLWEDIWSADRVLELVQYFVQDIRDRDGQTSLNDSTDPDDLYKIEGKMKQYGFPLWYDLHTDPKEENALDPRFVENLWVKWPTGQVLADHQASLRKEPPIRPGTPDPYVPRLRED